MSTPADQSLTIYDLSKLAGVSPSTVSTVLNGTWRKRRISEKTVKLVLDLARQHGYSMNMQARALRTSESGIIGMLLPLHDNRYFSSIAERFEEMARDRGLFPIVTCTRRDPDLEEQAANAMLAYRVDHIVCTGATAPDRIAALCESRGVPTFNLDLPGSRAPSVISDNYGGALKMSERMLDQLAASGPLSGQDVLFIGGREADHNTKERIRAFEDAHARRGGRPGRRHIHPCGYAASKAERCFTEVVAKLGKLPEGIFVGSTISLEGIIRWFHANGIEKLQGVSLCCFDWDPFVQMLGSGIVTLRQDVPKMMELLFDLIDRRVTAPELRIEVETQWP